MIRVKIIKPHKQYNVGDTIYVTPNVAHGLIDSGYATKTKDMVSTDYKTEKTSGNTIVVRTNKSGRRKRISRD